MQKSKLLKVLSHLSLEELRSLDKYLLSPYFLTEKQREVYPLFKYILSYAKNLDHPRLNKHVVYRQLFSKEKIPMGRLDKLMSALLMHTLRFIAVHFKGEKKDQLLDEVMVVRFFRRRGAVKYTERYLEKAQERYANFLPKDLQWYYGKYLLDVEETFINLLQEKDTTSFDFGLTLKSLDTFYVIDKLKHICILLAYKRFIRRINVKSVVSSLDNIKSICITQSLLEVPLIKVYFQVINRLIKKDEEEAAYWDLKALLTSYENVIPLDLLKILNGVLRNFIIRSYNHGAIHLVEEMFHLHKSHLEKGYLDFDGGIYYFNYNNLVNLGLRAKYFDWVLQFLNGYKSKLKGYKSTEEVYEYNLAIYYFNLKEYEKVIELSKRNYRNLNYKIGIKRLELKIYYEDQLGILDARMDAFKMFVSRLPKNKTLNYRRICNNNFINFLRQIHHSKTPFSKDRINKITAKIEKSRLLVDKIWLLEKLTLLKNKISHPKDKIAG